MFWLQHHAPYIPDLLLSLWPSTINGDKEKMSWDFTVLQGEEWAAHGCDIASMTPYLPGSFDHPPAEKINSRYKAWEYLMYIFALGLGLFYSVLPLKHWRNWCRLICRICLVYQFKTLLKSLIDSQQFLLNFVLEFKALYC